MVVKRPRALRGASPSRMIRAWPCRTTPALATDCAKCSIARARISRQPNTRLKCRV